jgi:hypothetical protein
MSLLDGQLTEAVLETAVGGISHSGRKAEIALAVTTTKRPDSRKWRWTRPFVKNIPNDL